MGTKTWAQALSQIGTSILNAIVSAIVRMFVTWIVQITVLRALQAVFGKTSNTEAATSAAAWAPAATAASIASYDAAATIGTAATIAGLRVATAFAAALNAGGGAYGEGGFTGMGGKYELAGIVHRGEYVMEAATTSRIGVQNLDAMRSADMSPATGGSTAPGGGKTMPAIHVNFFDNRQAMTKHIRENPDVHHAILDTVNRAGYQIAARG
jgi:hypothetical protein